MNKRFRWMPFSSVLFVLLSYSSAGATTVQELVAQNKLKLTVRMQTEGEIIANQPVIIEVEVATDRWFSKGTRVFNPDILDAVVLPISGSGINGTKRTNRVTWATQMREITLYPTRAGLFTVPSIAVAVSVNTEDFGIVEGQLFSDLMSFDVVIPSALNSIENYVVSPKMTLTVTGDPLEDQIFAVGEALSRTITLTASDVPGMMLPSIATVEIEGLSIYHKPPRISDRSSRGTLTGMRTETFTFIFETAGEFRLPEQNLFWWNSSTGKLTELLIPALTIRVSGGVVGEIETGDEKYIQLPTFTKVAQFAIVGCLFFILYCFYIFRTRFFDLYSKWSHLRYRQNRRAFIVAIEHSDYKLACQILYQIVGNSDENISSIRQYFYDEPTKLVLLEKLLASAFKTNTETDKISISEAKYLSTMNSTKKMRREGNKFNGDIVHLNPRF